jgi:hypothetical protein
MASASTSSEEEYDDDSSVLCSGRLVEVNRGTVTAGEGGRIVIGIDMVEDELKK